MRVLLFLLIFNTVAFGFSIYDLATYCQKYGQRAAEDIANYFHMSDVTIYENCNVSQKDILKFKLVFKGNLIYLDSTLKRVGLVKRKKVGLSEIPLIAKRIRRFYRNNGYYDVRVYYEIENDTCVLNIHEGKLYIIGNVYLGNSGKKYHGIKSKVMTEENINSILRDIEKRLREEGYFDYNVGYRIVESKYSYPFFSSDKFLNSVFSFLPFFHKVVDIYVSVKKGKKYDLSVTGVQGDNIRRSVKNIFVNRVVKLNSFYIGVFKEEAREFLKKHGFENPTVLVKLFGRKIFITIEYSRRYSEFKVDVVTNPNDDFIKNEMEKFLRKRRFDVDSDSLKAFMKKVSFDRGYCNPVIEKAFIKDHDDKLVMRIEINLGRKCSLGNVYLNGKKIKISKKGLSFFEIKKIKKRVYEKIKDSYYFEYVSFDKYKTTGSGVDLYFIADKSKLYLTESVYFDKKSVPVYQVKKILKKGELVTRSKVDKLKMFLRRMGYFEESSVNVLRIGAEDALIVIYNKMRPLNQVYGGVGYTSVSGVNAYLGYRRLNVFYHNMNTYYFVSLDEQKYNFNLLGYSVLLFDAYDEFDFTYHLKKDDYYTFESKKVMFKLSKWVENHTVSVNIKADKLKEYDLDYDESVKRFAADGNIISVGIGYTYQALDNKINPLNGYHIGAFVDVYNNLKEQSFYKYRLGTTFYKSFFKDSYLMAAKIKMGMFTGDEVSIPISYRFRLGGPDKMKGYGAGDIGCEDSGGRVFGGRKYTYTEIAFGRIFRKIVQLGVFYEMGNAFDDSSRIFKYKDLGLMFELRTPIGPLRISYANNYLFSNKKSQAFYITFGRVF